MKMEHLIIEGFCDGNENQDKYPCNGTLKFGVYCFECLKFSYTYCPNEIAISDTDGVVGAWIGFGGNMEPNDQEKREAYIAIWKNICEGKINESYDEYMKQIKHD